LDFISSRGMQRDNLMIVDFLNLCFRYKHANKKNFTADIISTIQSLGTSYGAKDIIIAGDWGSEWRKNIYPAYKANREEMKAKQTQEEQDAFMEFLEECNRALDVLSDMYKVFKFKGVEADDIAAFLATNYAYKYNHVWLISSDKDWDLLVCDNVSRFSYITRKEIKLENWYEHYEYAPENHISIKVLQGDTGDNVPGVPGIGVKRAAALIKEYGSALDIYDALPIKDKRKYIQNLNEFANQILINYELMDLISYCEASIGQENIAKIIEEIRNLTEFELSID